MHLQQTKVEKITEAAVKLTDGNVFTGLTHGAAFQKAAVKHKKTPQSIYCKLFDKSRDGFITSIGRFVSRKAAYKLAVKNQQMTPNAYAQANKDLWGDKIDGGDSLCALAFGNVRTDENCAQR